MRENERISQSLGVLEFSGVHQQNSDGACILLVHFLPQILHQQKLRHQQNSRCTSNIINPIFDMSPKEMCKKMYPTHITYFYATLKTNRGEESGIW
jgi:hypothetical protein